MNEAMLVRMKLTGLQLLFVALLSPPVIVPENLDPVEFLISKNYPRNKTLIPLPKDFDKFGDQKNDCCALQLFIEVKDYNGDGTGNDDGYSDNESQTEIGSLTLNFEHPDIRKGDIKFTMSVEKDKDKDKVKSKHLLNLDNCTNIIYKTFNIYATTTIVDVKDVRVVLVNRKDEKIVNCTEPNLAPEPREDQDGNDIVFVCVIVFLTGCLTGCLVTLLYYNYRKIKEKICGKTYRELATSENPEEINLSGGDGQSERAEETFAAGSMKLEMRKKKGGQSTSSAITEEKVKYDFLEDDDEELDDNVFEDSANDEEVFAFNFPEKNKAKAKSSGYVSRDEEVAENGNEEEVSEDDHEENEEDAI